MWKHNMKTVSVTTFRCPHRRTRHLPAMTICLHQPALLSAPLDLPELPLGCLLSSLRSGQARERTQTTAPSFQSCNWINGLLRTLDSKRQREKWIQIRRKLGARIQSALVHAHRHTQTQRRTSNSLGAERNTSIFVLLWQQVHLRHSN